jgi:hypothetical protein
MHVIFVEPRFPTNQARFVHALKEVGAYVTGIGETPYEYLGNSLQGALDAYEQIPNVCDVGRLQDAVVRIQKRGPWVDRIEATVEAHIMTTAKVREACGIPGTRVQTAYLCRDKPAMKEALRAAGVPTALSTGASSAEEVRDFAKRVGFPVILKPPSGAGAAGTYRADSSEELERILPETGVDRGATVAVEEFVEGHEGFLDTLTIGGKISHYFISHYYPTVLEAMRTRWVSPQIVTTNRVDTSGYAEVKALATRVIEALGIGTSATHMEWFYGPKGLKFSEIGCRPPGVSVWDIYGVANDLDLYQEWANVVVHEEILRKPSRRYSAGMIALRPETDGQITGYEGVERVQEQLGKWIIDAHFPPPGSRTQPIEGGYMANAYVRVKHPDYDQLRNMLDYVGKTIKVRAS